MLLPEATVGQLPMPWWVFLWKKKGCSGWGLWDRGMFRGSEGKQLLGSLPCPERLMVECTSNKHPFFRFPLKYFSYFAMAARFAPSCDSSSLTAAE